MSIFILLHTTIINRYTPSTLVKYRSAMNLLNNKIRPLSASESFYVDFKISVQVICELNGSLSSDTLQAALNHVARRHPFLGCCVIKDDDVPYFVKNEHDIVPLEVVKRTEINLEALQHAELNTPLDESKNLIRVVMLEEAGSCTLIVTLHHAIVDGLSTVQLIKSIFETCDDLSQFKNPFFEPLEIQPSIETLSSSLVSNAELIDFTQEFAKQAQSIPLQAIEPQTAADGALISVHVHNVKLSTDDTKKILQLCKANHTSPHGVIAAAHLIAIRQLIDDSDDEMILRCNSPVDLRQRLNPVLRNEHLLSAATGCGTNHAVSAKTSLWELAQEIGRGLQASIENRDVFKAHLTFMDTLMKHRMPNAVGVSSVGLIDIPKTYHDFECTSVYLTGVYQLPMFGVTVYTYDQQLVMTYLFVKPYYSAELMQKISALTLDEILKSI